MPLPKGVVKVYESHVLKGMFWVKFDPQFLKDYLSQDQLLAMAVEAAKTHDNWPTDKNGGKITGAAGDTLIKITPC